MKTVNCIVHTFQIGGEIEDPDVWAGESLYNWEHSDVGQWVINNTTEMPIWFRKPGDYGYQFEIHATFEEPKYIFWKLKYE